MPVLMNYPLFHADDDNGAPLTGGLLYSYIAGSSTSKATYTTRAMSVANANPVVLNSRGEAVIYGAGLYKLILKTAIGTTIWTQDNVELGTGQGSNVFYVDPSETDQGAAGNGASLYDILTALGTSEQATVFFPHNGVANTTTYTFSTTFDASTYTNVIFDLENGALLSPDSTKTLTLPSPGNVIAAQTQMIFSGAGSVVFAAGTGGKIYPGWWGGSTSASAATNVLAFQAAIDSMTATAYVPASFTYDGAIPVLSVPSGRYQFDDYLTISYYTKIIGEGQAIFDGTDPTKDIIYSQHPYHNEFKNITFAGGKIHINLYNGTDLVAGTDGLEGVLVRLYDCYFVGSADYAMQFTRNATNGGYQVLINGFDIFHCNKAIKLSGVDVTTVSNGWIEPTGASVTDDTAMIYASYTVNINNVGFYPDSLEFATHPTVRWIDNYGHVSINKCQFGAESGGGLPIVYNFVDALDQPGVSPFINYSGIVINDSMICSGNSSRTDKGVIVLKSGLPHVIAVENCRYLIDGYVINTISLTGGGTLATYLAGIGANEPLFNISIRNNLHWGSILVSLAADTSSDEDRLKYWLTSDLSSIGATTGNTTRIYDLKVHKLSYIDQLYGTSYAETSSAANTSIVDTGLIPADASSYMVTVIGNPNLAGSGYYKDTVTGILQTQTGFDGADPATYIYFDILGARSLTGVSDLTVTPKFWDGASETDTADPTTLSSYQIRLKISGYVGSVGYVQTVRIMRMI